MGNIKPIETQYKGYRFRSRLEARWAVFFDALGIYWEYESEGFELGNGSRYLPDFWVPSFDCFFEVKPAIVRSDMEKVQEFAWGRGGKSVCAVYGLPPGENGIGSSVGGYFHCIYETKIKSRFDSEIDKRIIMDDAMIVFCENCKKWCFDFGDFDYQEATKSYPPDSYNAGNYNLMHGNGVSWNNPCKCYPPHTQVSTYDKMLNACEIARSARFEYGEKPGWRSSK